MKDDTFEDRNRRFITAMGADEALRDLSNQWLARSIGHEYSYHFRWLGMPIIQYPQDIIALQEIIMRVRPQTIVETGIARGGSLVFSASMLELLGGDGRVVGVDVDIRAHNRGAIETHPMAKRITMVEGSSTDPKTFDRVCAEVGDAQPVIVLLDSNHTHGHVSAELALYSTLVRSGSYLIVYDTLIENMPEDAYPDRPWGRGDNALTAVSEFLGTTDRFEVDRKIEDKLQITVAPGGYLRCTKD